MSGERNLGQFGGFIAIGTVANVKDDPTQTGMVRVRWHTGSATQDQVADGDLPWSRTAFPTTSPSINQNGGPHTGLQVGSTVIGMPLDGSGQDYLVVATIPRAGAGSIDQPGQFDGDVPQPGKVQENGGESQPRYGDTNAVVSNESIVRHGESVGGNGRAASFAQLIDSIGNREVIAAESLVAELASSRNLSGAIKAAPFIFDQLKGALMNVPFAVDAPGMSAVVSASNMIEGAAGLIQNLGSLSALGEFRNVLGRLQAELGSTDITRVDPARLVGLLQRFVGQSELERIIGSSAALTASLSRFK